MCRKIFSGHSLCRWTPLTWVMEALLLDRTAVGGHYHHGLNRGQTPSDRLLPVVSSLCVRPPVCLRVQGSIQSKGATRRGQGSSFAAAAGIALLLREGIGGFPLLPEAGVQGRWQHAVPASYRNPDGVLTRAQLNTASFASP